MRSQICRLVTLCVLSVANPALADSVSKAANPAKAVASKPSEQSSSPANAAELFRAMATIDGLETRFREQKQLALLKAPLVSEGHLYYKRAGYLARLTEKPSVSGVRITPGSLEVNSGQGYQRVDLTGRPDIKLFVESFAKVLAGDYNALASLYEISFSPKTAESGWSLVLKPKSGNLVHLVKSLELRGQGFEVRELKILETKGDTSTTQLELVSAKRVYSTDEERTFFGIAAGASSPGEKK